MNQKLDLNLPNELFLYKDKIESSIKPFIEMKTKVKNDLLLWQSKFGGFPYFPKGFQYPIDSKGQAMFLLSQINFSEVPKLESFPDKGILQIFISGASEIYGICFESPTNQDDFRILYFPETTEDENLLITDFSFLSKSSQLPIEKTSSLSFTLKYAPIPTVDYQFEPKILGISLKSKYDMYKEHKSIYEEYEKLFNSEGHKIGGYPYFTQYDPREFEPYKDDNYNLLLQIDSDEEAGIIWGDCGVANFFISEQDLLSRNFSRVLYNWDCC